MKADLPQGGLEFAGFIRLLNKGHTPNSTLVFRQHGPL
jgi:hypothetical protein